MDKQSNESLFSMDDFRQYIRAWAAAKGRGEFRRISKAVGIHTTLVSQVLNGKKCLTEEQAASLASYMGLNQLESDYFLKLIQFERAGTENLRRIYQRHIKSLRSNAQQIKSRIPPAKQLSEEDQAIFYSSWQYGIVRLLTSIDEFNTLEEIASYLCLSLSRTQEIMHFLVSRGLCFHEVSGYRRTGKNTHVEATSPLAIRHHQNWRTKSQELLERKTSEDLAFTAAVAIAKRDSPKVRAILLETISKISKLTETSAAEEIAYLGVDWIKI